MKLTILLHFTKSLTILIEMASQRPRRNVFMAAIRNLGFDDAAVGTDDGESGSDEISTSDSEDEKITSYLTP